MGQDWSVLFVRPKMSTQLFGLQYIFWPLCALCVAAGQVVVAVVVRWNGLARLRDRASILAVA